MADPEVNILLKAKDLTKGVLGGVGNALAGLGKFAMGAAIGGIAAAAGAMVGGVKAATDWGEQLDNLQDLLGTTAQESSGLAVMANRIGLSSDELGQSLSIMTRGLLDVEGQAGPSAKAMEGLGISIYDANGQMKDAPDLLQEVADVLGNMPDGLAKSSAMMDIFGRSGVQMGDLLAAAANGGVAEFQAEAERLGLSFSQDKINSIIEFGKQTEELKSTFQGIAAQIGTAVLPYLSGLLDTVQTLIGPLMDAGLFSSEFKEALGSIIGDDTSAALLTFLQDLSTWLGVNVPIAIEYLQSVWTGILLPAIQAVWQWLSTVLMPFLIDTVFPWLQVAIPAALQFLSDVWTNVLQPAILAVWEWMSTVLIPFLVDVVFPWLQENIPKALKFLSDIWTNTLKPAIEAVWNWMSTVLIPFLRDTVKPWLDKNIPAAIQVLSDFWNNTLLPAITAVWEFIETYLMPIFVTVKDILEVGLKLAIETLSGIWTNTLLPALEDVRDFVRDEITPKLTWLKDKVIDPLAKSLSEGLKKALEWVNEQLKKLKEWLDKIKLPDWLETHSPTKFEMGIRGITDAMLELNRVALPGLTLGLAPLGVGAGARGVASASPASQRLIVYGGLHVHGVENGQDLLASLNDLMIG